MTKKNVRKNSNSIGGYRYKKGGNYSPIPLNDYTAFDPVAYYQTARGSSQSKVLPKQLNIIPEKNVSKKNNVPKNVPKKKVHFSKNIKRGGDWIPNEIQNIGYSLANGVNTAYSALSGVPRPVDPLPFKDQLTVNSNNLTY